MASPLDDVEQYQQEPDTAPPSQLDNAEQRLTDQLPNTDRYAHRQIVDQLRSIRVEREIEGRKARAQATATRLKASDLADRGIPTFREANGVTPVTDEAGAPLTNYDKSHDIAYDSAGNPRSVDYGPSGPPALNDPFANSQVETDQKTGDQYQKRAGLPWKWVGADEGIKSQRMQEEKDKAVKQEAALLGQKISIQHADLVAGDKEHQIMTKELMNEVPTLQDPNLAGAGRDAVLGAIDNHFNSEYARPEANQTNGWFSKELAPSAQKLRGEIDARKEGAMQKANRLFDLKDQQNALGDQIAANHDQRENEIDTLLAHGRGQQGPLDAQGVVNPAGGPTQIHTPNGNPYPITKDGLIDTNVPGGSMEDALQKLSPGPGWSYNGSSGQWSPPYSLDQLPAKPPGSNQPDPIQGVSPDGKLYHVDDKGSVTFSSDKPKDSFNQAISDGRMSAQDAARLAPGIEQLQTQKDKADAAAQALADKLKKAGAGSDAKAILNAIPRSAAVIGGALGGGELGAATGAGIGAAVAGAPTVGAGAPPGAAVGGTIGGIIGMVAGGWGAGKLYDTALSELAKYNQMAASVQASSQLHPSYNAIGELVGWTGLGVRGGIKLVGAARTAFQEAAAGAEAGGATAEAAQTAGAAAARNFIVQRAATGAATTVGVNAALTEGQHALGLTDQHYSLSQLPIDAVLGAALSGSGIRFRDVSQTGIVDIMTRGLQAARAGRPLEAALKPSEIDIFNRVNDRWEQQRQAGQPLVTPESIHQAITAPESVLTPEHYQRDVQNNINSLKPEERQAFDLARAATGLAPDATSTALGLPEQARNRAFTDVSRQTGMDEAQVRDIWDRVFRPKPVSFVAEKYGPTTAAADLPPEGGAPEPQPPKPPERKVPGRVVEPTEGEPNVSETPSTSQPARPEGSQGEPVNPNATGATGTTGALTEGSNEPAAGATGEAPATAQAGGSKESAKPEPVSPALTPTQIEGNAQVDKGPGGQLVNYVQRRINEGATKEQAIQEHDSLIAGNKIPEPTVDQAAHEAATSPTEPAPAPSRPVTGVPPAGDVKTAETQLWRLTSKDSPQLLNTLRKQYGDHPDYLDILNEHIQEHAGKAEAISGEHGVGDKITINNQNWQVTGVEGGNTKLERAGDYHQGGQVATQTLNTNFVRNQIASGHFTLEPASKVGQVPASEETAPSESAGSAGQEVAGKPQRQQSDVRNRPRISTPEAAKSAVEAATREHAADLKKSGTQVTFGPTKTESGFQTNADGDITVDHAKLVPHAEHIWERGGRPADWIKDAIGEEDFHSRQVKVAGNNFTKIYSAIHKQLPAEARAALEQVYPDDKTPASQAAEYVRMLWQHRTGKKITEAHFRNISGLLPHLIGKQPTLVEQELKRVMDYSAPAAEADTGSKPVSVKRQSPISEDEGLRAPAIQMPDGKIVESIGGSHGDAIEQAFGNRDFNNWLGVKFGYTTDKGRFIETKPALDAVKAFKADTGAPPVASLAETASIKERRDRRDKLQSLKRTAGEKIPAKDSLVITSLLAKDTPTVSQLNQALRLLQKHGAITEGGENAVKPGNAQVEGGTTPVGGKEGAGGQKPASSGGDHVVGETQGTGKRGEISGTEKETQPAGGRSSVPTLEQLKAKLREQEKGGVVDDRLLQQIRELEQSEKTPLSPDEKLDVPDDVAKALADLAEGLGAAAPKPAVPSSLKMAAIHHALTVKGHSIEKVAKDFAMPPKIVEQIYDKMAGVRLGAAAPVPHKIIAAAVQLPNGKIISGKAHPLIKEELSETDQKKPLIDGFVTNQGQFVTRDEALKALSTTFRIPTKGRVASSIHMPWLSQIKLGAAAPKIGIGTVLPPIVQKQLPKEKRAAALAAADKLVAAGFNTPEKFAGALAAVPALHPYAQSIWDVMAATGDVLRGTHDFNALLAPKEPKTATVADLHPITAHVRDQLIAGKAVPRVALTALADQHGVSTKEADELAEAGVVRAARYIIENVPSYQKPEAIFDRMVELHEDQPNLSAKTATSKIAQAYSTPIPVAYVASRLADITGGKIIYEPTAGNGALLIEANPDKQKVHANELNPARAVALKSQGFDVTPFDAAEWRPQIKADRMVENPPFGTVKDDNGESRMFDVQGLKTTQIDHAITLTSLEALADDGRAVLIVGGPGTGTGDVIPDDAKREKYYYEGQRGDFWKKLYENNRVIDHFTIEGDLYEKQGAGWPIDMVVIAGVGQSPIRLPSANAPRIISSWEELRNELSRTDAERIAAGKLSAGEAADEVSGAISGIRDITGSGAGPDRPRPGSSITSRPGSGGSSVSPAVSPTEQPEPTPAGGTETGVGPATGPTRGAVTGESGSEHEQRGQLGVEGEGYPEPDVAQYRVPYKPKSKHPTFHIFTPTNLEHPQSEALKKVAEKVGDIDEYVRTQLGYSDKEAKKFKEEYYSAEQIDTLALAIHAAENNSAFITGDQGGVGKGRIAAGMMLYAMRKGWIPIFMTRDEKLYAAMLEDLDDVGRGELVPMFTNNGMRFEDHRKQVWRTGNQSSVMNQIRDSGKLPDGIDLLFTSYYQVQNDVPRGWNPGKGARAGLKARKQAPPDGPRMEALRRIAPNSLFIMDESHEASGDSIRAWRLEPLLTSSPAAYYSSATFAKRPDSVGIYFRTTLSHAASTMQELIDALSTGGVPLQQASISMLADDGLYMRRERDFGESTFNTHISLENADRDKGLADSYTAGLRKILGLSNQIAQIAELINRLIKSQGKRMGSASSPRLESTNFAAVIHNLVSQYLLSIKTHATVERAIEHIKEGRRVVVTVQNTMESAIRSLRAGGLPLSFNGLLQRLLEQQRTLRTGGRNPEEFYISDEPNPEFEQYEDRQLETMLVRYETDEEGQRVGIVNGDAVTEYFRRKSIALINETREFIEGIDLGDMPLSPIDYMRHAMEDAGYRTAEITGRGVGLNRVNEVYDIKGFERSKKAQLGYMRDFNDGDVQFLVMNASGSTGISLHASKKFKNQDQRAMLVVQPHLDINQFMQSLWRIDRTGQVKPPFFEVIQTAIPAELRPAAVRERKMASLNANTTSNAKNEMRAQDMDIFNEFGDEVVYGYLASDPGFVTLLQWDAITDKNGNLVPFDSIEMEPGKFVAGVTGRLAILPTAEGEEFWNRVNEEYKALIQHLDDTGQNTLKVAAIDMRAETLSSREFTAGNPTGDSAFDGPSHMEQVKAQVGKAPRMGSEVLEKANEVQREAPETMRKWEATADDWYKKELDRRVANEVSYLTDAEREEAKTEAPGGDERLYVIAHKMSSWVTRMNNAREEISNSLRLLGDTVHIHSERGLDVYGAVIEAKLDDEHPLTPSKQEFNVWVNSTMRQIRFSAAQLSKDATTTPRDHFVEAYENTAERSNERYIVTGNLLAASVSLANQVQGQRIIVYTDDKGLMKQGILLPANFNPHTFVGREEVQGADHFQQLLDDGRTVTNRNQAIMIMKRAAGTYELRVPASRTGGGKYWENHTLRSHMNNSDFVQRGSQMVGTFGNYYLKQVFQTLTNADRLATQLFFNRPVTDGPATQLGAAAPRFARDYWTEDVKPLLANTKATMREVVDAAVHVLSPTHGVNKDVVDQVHKLLGERNQVAFVVDRTGEAFEQMFQSMPRPDQITFIDRVKTGQPQPTPELEQAARFIRGVDTEAWQAMHDASTAAGFKESPVKWLENHYRVMWKKIPDSVDRGGPPGQGKRPLRGSRGMAKQHTLDDMSEGIDRGGVPFTYNPITNLKMALADIWKYTTALKMWAWAKEHGFVSFVRGAFPKLPDGMVWLDDSIADVWFPAESGEGLIHAGKYAVEEGFGRLLNNFLSRDLVRQAKTGRGLMWLKNATTSLELSLSLFHGVFETGEAIASNIGLGLSKIYNRGILQKDTSALMSGMIDLMKSPASPVNVATLGSAFRKAAGRPDAFWNTPEGKAFLKIHPDARGLIDLLFTGGWKPTEVEADWKNKSVRVFMDAISDLKTGSSSNYIGAALRAFPAANEFLMGPLFDVYIPNLKIGQFAMEMRESLRQNDLKYGAHGYYIDRQGRRHDRPTNAELARKVWRLVEDRFGELNYDTLFWNNSFKSAMQLMFRSVTWKLGSVEAFYGAFKGQGKEFVDAFKERRAPELHRNMAWLFGIFLATAVLGTIIQTVFAKKKPQSLTDLVFPRIDPNDDKVRVSVPTYFKDLVHLVHSPTGYVKASLAGWIGRVADLLANKDYYGVQIRDTDDPATKQALAVGKYAAQSVLPFSIRGYKNLSSQQESTLRKSMALLGINPAPRYIGQTPAEKQVEKFWAGQRTEEGTKPEQYEIQKGKRELVSKIRHGISPDIPGALARGTIKPADIKGIYKRATMGQLASSIDRMPLTDAEKVYAKANAAERAQLSGIMARKRSNSLKRSGRVMYTGF